MAGAARLAGRAADAAEAVPHCASASGRGHAPGPRRRGRQPPGDCAQVVELGPCSAGSSGSGSSAGADIDREHRPGRRCRPRNAQGPPAIRTRDAAAPVQEHRLRLVLAVPRIRSAGAPDRDEQAGRVVPARSRSSRRRPRQSPRRGRAGCRCRRSGGWRGSRSLRGTAMRWPRHWRARPVAPSLAPAPTMLRYLGREVGGGRAPRQPGQVRKEAAATSSRSGRSFGLPPPAEPVVRARPSGLVRAAACPACSG